MAKCSSLFCAIFLAFSAFSIPSGEGADWGYGDDAHGPAHWADQYKLCTSEGPRQSPINVQVDTTEYKDLSPITLHHEGTVELRLKNNGHSVVAVLEGPEVTVQGGDLGGTYKAHSFHFHWGSTSDRGSEHTVDGHAFPLELHIVNYNTAYAGLGEAVPQSDGLAVLGILFEESAEDNQLIEPIIEQLKNVRTPSDEGLPLIHGVDLANDLLPSNTAEYFRYLGSLTTPSCDESVTWTLFSTTSSISPRQMAEFRQLLASGDDHAEVMVNNYRPTQPLNGRTVYRSFEGTPVKKEAAHSWQYTGDHGVSHWKESFDTCGGTRQSPIDILPRRTVDGPEDLDDLDLIQEDSTGKTISFVNNGHTVVGVLDSSVSLTGAGLRDVYTMHSFHFHWGSSSKLGSEHTVNGRSFPLELHMVHYDSERAPNLKTAVGTDNGLAVLGTLFKVSKENNTAYDPIINALRKVRTPSDDLVPMPHFDLRTLLPPVTKEYFRYEGSLTTPPCSETVVWTVFKNPQTISEAQLEEFRQILHHAASDDHPAQQLVDNWRPAQPIHTRKVYRSNALSELAKADSVGSGSSRISDSGWIMLSAVTLLCSYLRV